MFTRSLTRPSSLQVPPVLPGFPQHLPLPPHSHQPLTPTQLPWLAQLAASSCGEGVLVLEQVRSLAQGLQQTLSRLMEGGLENTSYVVIIVSSPGQQIQSCVVVTGEGGGSQKDQGLTELD